MNNEIMDDINKLVDQIDILHNKLMIQDNIPIDVIKLLSDQYNNAHYQVCSIYKSK